MSGPPPPKNRNRFNLRRLAGHVAVTVSFQGSCSYLIENKALGAVEAENPPKEITRPQCRVIFISYFYFSSDRRNSRPTILPLRGRALSLSGSIGHLMVEFLT